MSTATKTKKFSTVLAKAADIIEERGLNKEDYFDGLDLSEHHYDLAAMIPVARRQKPKCCTLGAIALAGGYADGFFTHRDLFEKYLGMDDYSIPDWNDTPSRRKRDVVRKLRNAAEAARKDGK